MDDAVTYKVLWVDDEYEMLESIDEEASDSDIELCGVSNADEAEEELKSFDKYDAVILDGLFWDSKADQGTPSSDTPFGRVASCLKALKAQKILLPWFILSGKARFTAEQNSLVEVLADKDYADGRVFDKLKSEERQELWSCIKEAVNALPDFQIKQKYAKLLACANDDFLGQSTYNRLFSLAESLENTDRVEDTADKSSCIRKVIESLFCALVKKRVIPTAVWENNGSINGCSRFLSGRDERYEYELDVIPPLVSSNLYHLLSRVQDGSHSEGNLKLEVDVYLSSADNDYFYRSLAHSLFDLLLWFREFHKNFDTTQLKYSLREIEPVTTDGWIKGKITEQQDTGWGTFESDCGSFRLGVPKGMMKQNDLKCNEAVSVQLKPDNNKHIKEITKQ